MHYLTEKAANLFGPANVEECNQQVLYEEEVERLTDSLVEHMNMDCKKQIERNRAMRHTYYIMQEYQDRLGWTDETALVVALAYIQNQSDEATFRDFLEQQAKLEEGYDMGSYAECERCGQLTDYDTDSPILCEDCKAELDLGPKEGYEQAT